MWVFPLYIHAKLKRKNAILVHSPAHANLKMTPLR